MRKTKEITKQYYNCAKFNSVIKLLLEKNMHMAQAP